VKDAQPRTIHLSEYRAPDFHIYRTQLEFDLYEGYADVCARLQIRKSPTAKSDSLVLDGQDLQLRGIEINGETLTPENYIVDKESLTLHNMPGRFELVIHTRIRPQLNTTLEGLYKSKSMFCTQCEAEGFRKITYYLDRPDVMSEFSTKVIAEKSRYPVLLSNGNKVESGSLPDGRHWVQWHDPHKKPCYLFALVAGDLVNIDGRYTTASGRDVLLRIFVEAKDKKKCAHAMTSLKKAMRWDEEVYGREYDLDVFMIVAVDDFNMGAMENKGLNIFNTSCVLASPETTTDASFQAVEGVVAHEYFHNWSGNRVTCRDWFQLSLKEGFTVFRDSEFSADMGSRAVKRVEDVTVLRTHQFAEDAGPMAHPVQPSSFIEISNFYTLTVYEKGAEVVRMIHSLLGAELFRKGTDLYFDRHDGCAVTIEDFVQAMADVSKRDFSQFMCWYRQAGTPVVSIRDEYSEASQEYKLTVKQSCPATVETKSKQPFLIPMAMGLLGAEGPISFRLQKGTTPVNEQVLEITEAEQTFIFSDVKEKPVPSLFRNFSAPVKLDFNYTLSDLQRIMANDVDGFCRWDASQQMAVWVINAVRNGLADDPAPTVDPLLLEAHGILLKQAQEAIEGETTEDLHMLAYTLTLPSEDYLHQLQDIVDVEGSHHARNRVKRKLSQAHYDHYNAVYDALNQAVEFSSDAKSIARRALKNVALSYLVASGKEAAIERCLSQFQNANNMTDQLSALREIVHSGSEAARRLSESCLQQFYEQWKHEALVVNHWLSVQATNPSPNTLKRVLDLMAHDAFDASNPNKLRALIGGYCSRNAICFHDNRGAGYEFLADRVIDLNRKNPQIASRLLTPLSRWRKFDESRQSMMKAALARVKNEKDLSKDVYEVVVKSLSE